MEKKNIRSEYIKKLMEDKESISTKLEETTKDTLKEILSESVNKELRNILNESEDDFEEEEVSTDDELDNDDEETTVDADSEDDDADSLEDGGTDSLEDGDTDSLEDDDTDSLEDDVDAESSDLTDGEDVWSSLEDLKSEDGEYDLTGMDKEEVIKVLKVMSPEDGVRVVKNTNGSITLKDDETDKEYIIDIDGEFGDTETEFEVEVEDFDGIDECVNEDLGYTTNYQKKTAMTTPKNNEPSKNTYSMDGGVPTDTSKPWGKKGSTAPYGEISEAEDEIVVEVECEDGECIVDEAMTTQENGAYNRGTGMVHTNTNKKSAKGRNASAGGQKISGTADNSYSGKQLENIKRKANVIFNENKELKNILSQLKSKLEESIVINASLGKIIQLVTENTTSRDEKVNIVKRFNNVRTIQESRELYNTISNELKSVHNNTKTMVSESMDKQIAEGKNNNIIETSIYKSTDLSNTLDLMDRMMKL